ncbi:GGDEF domain-containing protein [Solimonas sp. C16B3]|uniref:diguanylate cyclase n=2 Tax=Solimonas marina TaxID=2714601 RepID=A0A969W796_9GAMM|nr:GGDEF domain-containing protein [Solimonas marina]
MYLDTFTVVFIGFVQSLCIAAGFSLILLVLRRRDVARLWSYALWLVPAGAAILSLRGHLPELPAILIGNGCFTLSMLFLLQGVAVHVGRPRPVWMPLLLVAAVLLGLFVFTVFWPSISTRVVLYAISAIVWDVWIVGTLLRHGPSDVRFSCRFAAAAFALDGLNYVVRLVLPMHEAGQQLLQLGMPLAVSHTISVLLSLVQCFALLLLIVERLMVDLRRMARIDGLTGLLTRVAMLGECQQALAGCREQRRPFALMIFDLDHFKNVNDSYGHLAGDAVLRHFAAVMRAGVEGRPHLLGRHGGEEFVLALPGATAEDAMQLAETLRTTLAATPARFESQMISITTSVGLAVGGGSRGVDELIAQADAALYRSKAEGRNRITRAAAA